MSYPILTRGSQSKIDSTPIEDGKLRFGIDSGRLFVDSKNARVEITDFVKGLSYQEIISLQSPLRKLYLSTDTHQILMYNFYTEKWEIFGSADVCITNLKFLDDGSLLVTFGANGETKIVKNEKITSDISEMQTTIQTLTEEVKNLKTTIDNLSNKISSMENILNKYQSAIEIVESV